MKILLSNNGKGWSGGQEHLEDLALELRRPGVDIHFTSRAGTVSETRFRDAGFAVYPIPYRHGIGNLKALTGLMSLMRRKRFAMGARGYEPVEQRYSLRAMEQSYLEFYRRLVASPDS